MEDPDPRFFEPFTTLGLICGVTQTIQLGTAATIPLRHPVHLAKTVATLVELGEREIILGIGAGHRDDEFHAVGWDSTTRERMTEIIPETIEILNALWSGSRPPTTVITSLSRAFAWIPCRRVVLPFGCAAGAPCPSDWPWSTAADGCLVASQI